jgi:hypothetical protein
VPLLQVVEQLFDLSRNTCERLGDSELLAKLERTIITQNGAERQRKAWEQHHSCKAIARYLVDSLNSTAPVRMAG